MVRIKQRARLLRSGNRVHSMILDRCDPALLCRTEDEDPLADLFKLAETPAEADEQPQTEIHKSQPEK